MKTLTNFAAASGSSILLLFLFLCWSSLQTLQAQTPYDSYYELPEKYSHLLEAGIDLGPGMKEMPAIHRSDEYLVKLDTLKSFSPRNGVTTLTNITAYTFDENYNNTKRVTSSIRQNLGLIPVNIYLGVYDPSGLLVSDTIHFLNAQQLWQPSTYRDYEFDQDGMTTRSITRRWDVASAQWHLSSKTEFEIEDGQLVKRSAYNWDESIQEYYLTQEVSWDYDDGLLVEFRVRVLNASEGTINITLRISYEYNDDRLLSVTETYNRQNPDNQLRPVSRSEFFYNADHLAELENHYLPILPQTNGVEWYLDQRSETSFTDFGKAETILVSDWLEDEEEWEPVQRTENTYDSYENLLNSFRYFPHPTNPGNWLLDQNIESEYNYDFASGTYLSAPGQIDGSSHMLTTVTTSLVNPVRPGFLREYIYSDISVNTVELAEESNFLLFPSPVKDMLSVRLEKDAATDQKIRVVDIAGRMVYQNSFTGSLDISTDQWPAGIYTVVLKEQNGAAVISRQFIKQ